MSYQGIQHNYQATEIVTPVALVYNNSNKLVAVRCVTGLRDGYYSRNSAGIRFSDLPHLDNGPVQVPVISLDIPLHQLANFASFSTGQGKFNIHCCNKLGKVYQDGRVIEDCLQLCLVNNGLVYQYDYPKELSVTIMTDERIGNARDRIRFVAVSAANVQVGLVLRKAGIAPIIKSGVTIGNIDMHEFNKSRAVKLTEKTITITAEETEASAMIGDGVLGTKFVLKDGNVAIPEAVFNATTVLIPDCSYGKIDCSVTDNAMLNALAWRGVYRSDFKLMLRNCVSLNKIALPLILSKESNIVLNGLRNTKVWLYNNPENANVDLSQVVYKISLIDCQNIEFIAAPSATANVYIDYSGNTSIVNITGSGAFNITSDSQKANFELRDFDSTIKINYKEGYGLEGQIAIQGKGDAEVNVHQYRLLDHIATQGNLKIICRENNFTLDGLKPYIKMAKAIEVESNIQMTFAHFDIATFRQFFNKTNLNLDTRTSHWYCFNACTGQIEAFCELLHVTKEDTLMLKNMPDTQQVITSKIPAERIELENVVVHFLDKRPDYPSLTIIDKVKLTSAVCQNWCVSLYAKTAQQIHNNLVTYESMIRSKTIEKHSYLSFKCGDTPNSNEIVDLYSAIQNFNASNPDSIDTNCYVYFSYPSSWDTTGWTMHLADVVPEGNLVDENSKYLPYAKFVYVPSIAAIDNIELRDNKSDFTTACNRKLGAKVFCATPAIREALMTRIREAMAEAIYTQYHSAINSGVLERQRREATHRVTLADAKKQIKTEVASRVSAKYSNLLSIMNIDKDIPISQFLAYVKSQQSKI